MEFSKINKLSSGAVDNFQEYEKHTEVKYNEVVKSAELHSRVPITEPVTLIAVNIKLTTSKILFYMSFRLYLYVLSSEVRF